MASSVGPRSPEASRERTRCAAVSTGQRMRSIVTLAQALVAISRKRRRCSSDLNDPTAMTSLYLDSASATAAAIAPYACTIASLLRSPAAVRAAAPRASAKVSDAKLTAFQRSTARRANVDFPAPGMPHTIRRRFMGLPITRWPLCKYSRSGRASQQSGPRMSGEGQTKKSRQARWHGRFTFNSGHI
jgi:hypothetical protein